IPFYDAQTDKMLSPTELGTKIAAYDKTQREGVDVEKMKVENPNAYKIAQMLAEYRLPLTSRNQAFLKDPASQQILAAATTINPRLSTQDYLKQSTLARSFGSLAPNTAGGNITSINTAIQHLERLDKAADDLRKLG